MSESNLGDYKNIETDTLDNELFKGISKAPTNKLSTTLPASFNNVKRGTILKKTSKITDVSSRKPVLIYIFLGFDEDDPLNGIEDYLKLSPKRKDESKKSNEKTESLQKPLPAATKKSKQLFDDIDDNLILGLLFFK